MFARDKTGICRCVAWNYKCFRGFLSLALGVMLLRLTHRGIQARKTSLRLGRCRRAWTHLSPGLGSSPHTTCSASLSSQKCSTHKPMCEMTSLGPCFNLINLSNISYICLNTVREACLHIVHHKWIYEDTLALLGQCTLSCRTTESQMMSSTF